MKVTVKGVKEDGTFDVERKSTAVLITELIAEFPKMCQAEIAHSLEEIRKSAEMDDGTRRTLAHCLKEAEAEKKKLKAGEDIVNEHESELIHGGMSAIQRAHEHGDMATVLTIIKLCKAIAGDKFSAEITE